MEESKYYKIRSAELLYSKGAKIEPWYLYIILALLNKFPTKLVMPLKVFFKTFRIRCNFTVLNRVMHFYLYSNFYDFKYHGGMAHEIRVSENLLRLTPQSSVLFDIGCATGWYSILLSAKCEKILGFDPYDQSSLPNIKLNGIKNFELYPYFLSDHQDSGKVKTTTLDNLVKNNFPWLDIIKMDVECEEYKILLGAKDLFSSRPPKIVLIEAHSEELFYNCLNFLKSYNYNLYSLGCPKINVGGDIYPLSYNLNTDVFTTQSETRVLLGLK